MCQLANVLIWKFENVVVGTEGQTPGYAENKNPGYLSVCCR
jgi:hypothetical protein